MFRLGLEARISVLVLDDKISILVGLDAKIFALVSVSVLKVRFHGRTRARSSSPYRNR